MAPTDVLFLCRFNQSGVSLDCKNTTPSFKAGISDLQLTTKTKKIHRRGKNYFFVKRERICTSESCLLWSFSHNKYLSSFVQCPMIKPCQSLMLKHSRVFCSKWMTFGFQESPLAKLGIWDAVQSLRPTVWESNNVTQLCNNWKLFYVSYLSLCFPR